jgi:cytochrome c peroxidase
MAGAPRWRWALPAGVAPPVVPAGNAMTAARVELGRRLFYDADLSANGTMACSACHEQRHAFADGNRTRPGVYGDPGRRNVPGLANVAWFGPLTWADPRITTLEMQVTVPVLGTHPIEMGMAGREAEIVTRLGRDPCYVRMFRTAFPKEGGAIHMGSVSKAIAAFERTLISFGSAYDRGTMPDAAQRGATLFRQACASCHAGQQFTDGAFHRLEAPMQADRGLGEITGRKADDGSFRTPGLRNVALTTPYFHDGSAAGLGDAIDRHRLSIAAAGRADLIAFLEALTDRDFVTDRRFTMPDRACGKRL